VQAELLRLERRRVAEAQVEAAALRARLMRAEALVRELRAAVAAARGGGGVDGALRQVATHIPPTPISFPPLSLLSRFRLLLLLSLLAWLRMAWMGRDRHLIH